MIDQKIIKIASKSKFYGLKKDYTHRASLKNKTCGDKITLELKLKRNNMIVMRYETESCIFCSASASLLANYLNIFKRDKLENNVKILKKFFKEDNFKLPKKFYNLKSIFKKRYFTRSDCIMLPYNALLKALKRG